VGLPASAGDLPDSQLPVTIFNSDGSRAANCGNAMRCIATEACRRLVVLAPVVAFTIATHAKVIQCHVRRTPSKEDAAPPTFIAEIGMGVPTCGLANAWTPSVERRLAQLCADLGLHDALVPSAWAVNTGNNHIVVETTQQGGPLDADTVRALGTGMQTGHDLDGVNVHVVTRAVPTSVQQAAIVALSGEPQAHVWQTAVWERGAGPTLACGTGACAVAAAVGCDRAAASSSASSALSSTTVTAGRRGWTAVAMPGGLLLVATEPDGAVVLVGPATHVYSGSIQL
jgi:diaminopimelate epimerase